MARASSKSENKRQVRINWRAVISACLLSLVLMAAVFAWQQTEQFLLRDPHFMLARPTEYGEESSGLRIDGVRFASRAQVLRVFQPDIGRSLFLFRLEDRRKALLHLPWIKDASIQRVWPNHVFVRISERQPAAFVQLKSESMSRWALIDSDGVILDPPLRSGFKLPVVTGIQAEEPPPMRGVRVRRMLRMLDDIGDFRQQVSEVDVADLDDLRATIKMRDRALILMLGDQNFNSRLRNFYDHYEEIQKRISDLTILDLRLDDRITVVGEQR
jgi:cell division protein FtsQ